MIIVAGVAVVGGAAFVAFRYASDVRGDAEPVTLSETYTHAEPGFSFQYPAAFRAHEIPQADDSTLLLVEDPTREKWRIGSFFSDEQQRSADQREELHLYDRVYTSRTDPDTNSNTYPNARTGSLLPIYAKQHDTHGVRKSV
jgi:hypothetical protein